MMINVTITRSKEWVQAQRLATGENVQESLVVPVEAHELSIPARKVILERCGGVYCDIGSIAFSQDGSVTSNNGYGRDYFLIDSYSPTVAEISEAICAARHRVYEWKENRDAEVAEREAEKARVQAEKAERGAAVTAARELLADEISAMKSKLANYVSRVDILSTFIAGFDDEVLEARMGSASYRKEVEDAADCYIFTDEE